jgi:hypothetical protein
LTGLEDVAWAKQILAAGYRVVYEAEAEIIHIHNETPKALYNRYRREAVAMKIVCPHEEFSFFDLLRMYPAYVFSDCRIAANSGVLRANLGSILTFRLMQFLGTWRGFSQHGLVTQELKSKFFYPENEPLTRANGERLRSVGN